MLLGTYCKEAPTRWILNVGFVRLHPPEALAANSTKLLRAVIGDACNENFTWTKLDISNIGDVTLSQVRSTRPELARLKSLTGDTMKLADLLITLAGHATHFKTAFPFALTCVVRHCQMWEENKRDGLGVVTCTSHHIFVTMPTRQSVIRVSRLVLILLPAGRTSDVCHVTQMTSSPTDCVSWLSLDTDIID